MASARLRELPRIDIAAHIEKAADWVRGAQGRRRLLLAAGLGGIAALAYAPFYLWPLLFLMFPALVWMIDGAKGARRPWLAAALAGWAFGFGHFLVGLHWIGFAFVVDVATHGWQLPFAMVLMPGGLALFFAAAAGVARLFWARGAARIATLAATLAAVEWLRGHILTGFPWNLPGYAWGGWDAMFQSVSLFGIYGLSLVTLLIVLAPAALVDAEGKRSRAMWPAGAAFAALIALFVFGWVRLPADPAPVFDKIALRIVQPNVPQAEKWRPDLLERNWRSLMDLTRSPGLETRTHVIWTEAAPPFFLLSEPEGLRVIGAILDDRTTLITGTIRVEDGPEKRRYFNSMAVVSGAGQVLGTYDKSHLVPFGEYLPLFQLLEPLGITKLTGGTGGYSEGGGVKTLTIPGTPAFTPLICYEVIFPGEVVEAGTRPEWLVTLTDDSWFGPWTGPYQHLGIAKIRAAEEGLAIVRAANTGVSAVIDPYGRIVTSLGLDITGVLDATLPKPLKPTLFTQVGDILFGIMLIASAGLGFFFYRTAPLDS